MAFSKSPTKREVFFKGQYYHMTELSKIYNIPRSTLVTRYQRGDRDDYLVRPVQKKFIKSYVIIDQINRKRERDGEVLFPSDKHLKRVVLEDDEKEFINNLKIELDSMEKEPEHVDMGENTMEGGFEYYG